MREATTNMRGLIIRAVGLILCVVGALMCIHAYKELNLTGRAKLVSKSLGDTGSKYRVCGKDDANIASLTDDFAEDKVSNLKYHFYNIENPKEYLLDGNDAIAVEKGPYMLKKHSIKNNIGFKVSTLTDAGEPEVNGAIEYDEADAYIVLDKNTDVTSTMARADDLTLSWASSQRKTVTSYDKSMSSHLSMSDEITNLSPVYLSALGEANDELSLILSMSCTPAQVANIPLAGSKGQCDANQLNDMSVTDCACCMLHDEYEALGSPADFVSCNAHLDDEGPVLSTLSLLAYYDGGVAIKDAGEPKYDGSGNFAQTVYKQDKIYTPLIQSHTVNDLLFGYPSAYIGKAIPNLYFAKGKKIMQDAGIANPTNAQIATEMLTGSMDDELPFQLGNMAAYTKDVGAVCLSTCASVATTDPLNDSPLGHTCEGHAPARHTTSVTDEIVLGEIDCKPYSATYYTKEMCTTIDFILGQNPSAAGMEACTCADGSDDYKTSGCCLASGSYNGMDLTADGCLYPVAGEAGTNYAGKDAAASSGKPTIDVGKAIQAWSSNEPSAKDTQFMCPAEGVLLDEHKYFGRFEKLSGSSSYNTYIHTGNPRIRQGDASHPQAAVYTSTVNGAKTEYFPGTGLSAGFSDYQISHGHTFKEKVPVYIEQMKGPVMLEEDWAKTAIVCDEDLCFKLARLLMTPLNGTSEVQLEGIAMPYAGVQSVGHMKGPSANGRPMYVHQPLYYNGDVELLTQQDSSYAEGETGNGIKMYRPKDGASDPGAFTVGGTNANYELVDEALLDAKADHLQSYLDLEPATGLGIRSKLRFGVSYSIWECDPESNDHCKLSRHSDGTGKCYGTVGDDIFTSYANATKKALLVSAGKNDFTYPCSAANVMTPKVVGGKITPMFWYEDARSEVGAEEVEDFKALADEHKALFYKFFWVYYCGWMMWCTFGIGLFFRCCIFSPRKQFLMPGTVGGGANNATASSTTSSAASTTSSTE